MYGVNRNTRQKKGVEPNVRLLLYVCSEEAMQGSRLSNRKRMVRSNAWSESIHTRLPSFPSNAIAAMTSAKGSVVHGRHIPSAFFHCPSVNFVRPRDSPHCEHTLGMPVVPK